MTHRILNIKRLLVVCAAAGLLTARIGFAAEFSSIPPPVATLVPQNLGNNEIWYIGGTAAVPRADVLIFLQNTGGEMLNFSVRADETGEWLYTHTGFLKEGEYRAWAQLKVGDQFSPPGPQAAFRVAATAFRVGSLRIGYEALAFGMALVLFLILIGVSGFALYHFHHLRRSRARLRAGVREAAEEARRGFALLRQDIREELNVAARIRKSRELDAEELRREEKLIRDLDMVERHIMEDMRDEEAALLES